MKKPSPESCFGGFGRRGEATVPIGAALTRTRRRTPAESMASTMARVPRAAMPASDFDRGPRPESAAWASDLGREDPIVRSGQVNGHHPHVVGKPFRNPDHAVTS